MTTAKRFEDLDVWQRARELANLVYDLTQTPAFARDKSLQDQMRRAAVSVMSNIAEGFDNRTQALFVDYLGRAKASSGELRAQLYLTSDRGYILEEDFQRAKTLAETCSRQIAQLVRYLESQPNTHRLREDSPDYDA